MKLTKILAAFAALTISAAVSAQSYVSIPLSKTGFKNTHITRFEKGNYQGMDCYKDYVFSCKHTGIATIWKYRNGNLEKLGAFDLATHRLEV